MSLLLVWNMMHTNIDTTYLLALITQSDLTFLYTFMSLLLVWNIMHTKNYTTYLVALIKPSVMHGFLVSFYGVSLCGSRSN